MERKEGRDKEEEEASSNSPVGDFSSVERIYAATYPGWLLNVRSVSSPSLSLSPFLRGVCLYDDASTFQRVYIRTHTRGPPCTSPSRCTARRDRDAKETRAAFKLAATKRINSPGSLDLLIRAAVAFLRGLDRRGPETPRPSCFLAIASASRLSPSRRACTPARSARFHASWCARTPRHLVADRLFHGFFLRGEGVAGARQVQWDINARC